MVVSNARPRDIGILYSDGEFMDLISGVIDPLTLCENVKGKHLTQGGCPLERQYASPSLDKSVRHSPSSGYGRVGERESVGYQPQAYKGACRTSGVDEFDGLEIIGPRGIILGSSFDFVAVNDICHFWAFPRCTVLNHTILQYI